MPHHKILRQSLFFPASCFRLSFRTRQVAGNKKRMAVDFAMWHKVGHTKALITVICTDCQDLAFELVQQVQPSPTGCSATLADCQLPTTGIIPLQTNSPAGITSEAEACRSRLHTRLKLQPQATIYYSCTCGVLRLLGSSAFCWYAIDWSTLVLLSCRCC